MSDINKQIGARLAEVRRAHGLSQTALGRLLGVSFQQVQKYERGSNRISAASLLQVCKALGIPMADFLARIDPTPGADPLEPVDVNLAAAVRHLSPRNVQVVTSVAEALQSGQP